MNTPETIIQKLEDAKNGIYSTAELECIWVPNAVLPESYRDEREGGRTLARLQKQIKTQPEIDPREANVVISDGKIQYGNQERIDILNRYRANVEAGEDIQYEENDYRLYRNQQAFAEAMGLELEEEEEDCKDSRSGYYHRRHPASRR